MRALLQRSICVLILVIPGFANAASLSTVSDKTTYNVGETITLTVTADDQGATTYGIFGSLLYNGALVSNGTRSQTRLVGPLGNWILGVLNQADSGGPTGTYSWAFNQIAGFYAQTATNLPGTLSIVTLIAQAVGTVNVSWDSTGGPNTLAFFGLTNAPGTSFTIVPEPGVAALLGLGLLGLASWRRRRA
jgi:hypothetical protein